MANSPLYKWAGCTTCNVSQVKHILMPPIEHRDDSRWDWECQNCLARKPQRTYKGRIPSHGTKAKTSQCKKQHRPIKDLRKPLSISEQLEIWRLKTEEGLEIKDIVPVIGRSIRSVENVLRNDPILNTPRFLGFNELVLSAEQILENMKAIRDKSKETELYDGLTEEQWQTVIDEELICLFWDEVKNSSNVGKLHTLNAHDEYFAFSKYDSCAWKHCKIHESQPQFCNGTRPEGLDDEDVVIVFYTSGGYSIGPVDTVFDWAAIKRWQRVKI